MSVLQMVLGGGAIAAVASVLGSLLTGLLQRPQLRADAVTKLTAAAVAQVDQLQERTAEAEREATAARNDLTEARKQMRLLAAEIDNALATLRTWRAAILAPDADLDRLRAMVSADPGPTVNGHHR